MMNGWFSQIGNILSGSIRLDSEEIRCDYHCLEDQRNLILQDPDLYGGFSNPYNNSTGSASLIVIFLTLSITGISSKQKLLTLQVRYL